MFGLRDARGMGGWGGGYEGKTKYMYLQWASYFWLSIQSFIFPRRNMNFWLWVCG